MSDSITAFLPDWVSPPGDTIFDLIEERGWTKGELAKRLGYTNQHIMQLINGDLAITHEVALQLEQVLGSTAGFWLAREAKYREHRTRLDAGSFGAN